MSQIGCNFSAVEGFTRSSDDADRESAPTPSSAGAASTRHRVATGRNGSTADTPSEAVREGSSRTLWRRVTATRRSRLAWAVGALIGVLGIVAMVLRVSAARPDATLRATTAVADDRVRELVVGEVPWLEIDTSTLRAFGSYFGLDIWSGVNAFDSPCLVAVHRANDVLSEARCAPPAADLIMDVSSSGDGFEGFDGVVGDGMIRFILRGETVDAYVHLMTEAD
jgi:hypothetical protein